MIIIFRQRQFKICLAVYTAGVTFLIMCAPKISEYSKTTTLYNKLINTISINNKNKDESWKSNNPRNATPQHMETIFSKTMVTERTMAESGTWIQHLCPRYKTQDASKFTKLTWRTPSEDTIFFTQMSCRTALTRREVLAGLRNVQLAWLDLDQVFNEEPLQRWHGGRLWLLEATGHMVTIVGDAARVELLRRYGGTYLDLDALTLRPLPNTTNWLARVTDHLVGNGVLSFTSGHPLLQAVVADIPTAFDPTSHISIGPELLTRHLQRLCPDNASLPSGSPAKPEACGSVTIWPSQFVYPFHFGFESHELPSIFREGLGLGPAFFNSTRAFSLHLYNSLSERSFVTLTGDSILKEAFCRNCPQVMQILRKHRTFL
ncbi:lactosylceramide 4-alpha-galactosyltransferase-like isoform X2 [Panulirus ornatus]|uniref:lactosylceramide 4-alpha-galactosyltransferase-like isoform X2 n=1 Tax=Panulirus ornatus TaxID=150431 RepID=UPI003A86F31E